MSGRKRPNIPQDTIEVIFEALKIKKLRNQIAKSKQINKQLSKKVDAAFEKIKKSERYLMQQKKTLDKLNNQIDTINQRDKNSKEYAGQWLDLIKKQHETLTNLEINRFFMQEYNTYADQIGNMTENISKEQYQACTALAQNWHTNLKNDMKRIEQVYIDGKELEVELEDSFGQLKAMMQKNTIKREFDVAGGEKEAEEIDISYWAEDEWKQTNKIFCDIESKMKNLCDMDLQQMHILDEEVDEAVKMLNDANRKAELRFINNIRKMDMQESIAKKMLNRGFEIVDNVYEDEDERKNNILLMENERGEKILITIGDENEELNMEVDFNSLDLLTHSQRFEGIMQAVGAKNYQTVSGYENKPAEKERFDLKHYTKKQTQ